MQPAPGVPSEMPLFSIFPNMPYRIWRQVVTCKQGVYSQFYIVGNTLVILYALVKIPLATTKNIHQFATNFQLKLGWNKVQTRTARIVCFPYCHIFFVFRILHHQSGFTKFADCNEQNRAIQRTICSLLMQSNRKFSTQTTVLSIIFDLWVDFLI